MSELQPVSFRKPHRHEPRKPKKLADTTWKPWGDAEDQVVRDHYPQGGKAACLPLLPGRSPLAISNRAGILAVKYVGSSPNGRPRVQAPANIDDILREEWSRMSGKKRGEISALAMRLNVPRHWLSAQARRLGLAMPHKKEPRWTAPETELLKRVPLHDVDKCSRIFREHGFARSPMSIRVRAQRLQLSRRYNETLSATRIAKILGVDGKTVTREILQGNLTATKRQTERLAQQGGDPWSVERADLRRYILDQLGHIDLRKVEKFAFVEILAGEPLEAAAK